MIATIPTPPGTASPGRKSFCADDYEGALIARPDDAFRIPSPP
jgi:hypothetical protein